MKSLFSSCLLVLFCASAFSGEAAKDSPLLTILFTGESHGALLPCECPLQPLGGVARRATAIRRYRERGNVLLFDLGGFNAGGIYDEQSDGDPQRDELRTRLMGECMQLMRYDRFLPGQHDSAGAQMVEIPSLGTVSIQGWREGDAARLDKITTGKHQSLEIHLSRMGEENSELLAARIPQADLILNAGRKSTQRESWRVGQTTLANFDYESRRLGVVEVYPASPGKSGFDLRVRMDPLGPDIPDDPAIAEKLKPYMDVLKKAGKKRLEGEFWTMPECPGCAQVRPELEKLASDLGERANISVHYVLHKEDDGKFGSLHGEREMQEARVQAIIRNYYPERIWAWLGWRDGHRDAPWEEGARALGLLPARVRGALSAGEAESALAADYELMQRRHVDGTPSIVIANRVYEGEIDRMHILQVACGLLQSPKPGACKDVPACFYDTQCRKRGFIGRCVDAGKPEARCDQSRPALKIPATIILDRDNVYDNHEKIMEILIGNLPGVEFKTLDMNDPSGSAFIERLNLPRLPAYVLDPLAKAEADFADGLGKVVTSDPGATALILRPDATGAHRIVGRERKKGRADLYVSRFSKFGQEALETALQTQATLGNSAPELEIHDVLYWKESGGKQELAANGGVAEVEEAARAEAVRKVAPKQYNDYLVERGRVRGSSYWDAPLKKLGIDAKKVRALAEGPAEEIMTVLRAEADTLKTLKAGGEIVLLTENCELIPIHSRAELRQVLEKIGRNRK